MSRGAAINLILAVQPARLRAHAHAQASNTARVLLLESGAASVSIVHVTTTLLHYQEQGLNRCDMLAGLAPCEVSICKQRHFTILRKLKSQLMLVSTGRNTKYFTVTAS